MTCFTRCSAKILVTVFAGVAGMAGMGTAAAADYPTRPVKWIVPYPPGGTTDVLARIMAQWLSEKNRLQHAARTV